MVQLVEMTPQLDMKSAVKELHLLNSRELGKLIRDSENGTIQQNGSSFEINVEALTRHLGKHIMTHLQSFKQDEQHFTYLLSGFRLLHTLYDIAFYNVKLKEVLVEDTKVSAETLDLIFSMVTFLRHVGEKIDGSSQMVHLYSALLASSLYLIRPLISSEWHKLTLILLAHPKVDEFTTAAFTAVNVVTNFLQAKLQARNVDFRLKSNANEVYSLLLFCEASLQFLLSLCQQMIFREHIVQNKELCGEGVVLKLVRSIMKLPQVEDPYLEDVVYRLKSKVLSIMILLCEAKSVSFLDVAFNSSQRLDLAESTVFEVLEVVKNMFYEDLKDHGRGILQLNAMRLTEIFSSASSFRTYIVLNLTEVLTQVLSQPQREFLSTWCSNDREPAEEDIVMEFDPISAAGQVLGVVTTSQVRHSTWSNFQAPQIPFTQQRTSFLVKILNNLTCYGPDLCEEEKALFINEFLECLQKEYSNLPHGVAERTAAASRNLSSLLTHAKFLTRECLTGDDVYALRGFINDMEQLLAVPESDMHTLQELHSRGQCSSPKPQVSSPNEHHKSGNDDGCVPVSLAMVQLEQLTCNENRQNESNDVVGEDDQMIDLGDGNSGAQNTEAVKETQDVEEIKSLKSDEKLQKKRGRAKMNDTQINILESALRDELDLKRVGSLQFWAEKLSLNGPKVTSYQLKNWLNNRRAKRARTAAKEPSNHSDSDDDLTEIQTISDSPERLPSDPSPSVRKHYDPSPSVSHRTRRKGSVSRTRGTETTPDPVMGLANRFNPSPSVRKHYDPSPSGSHRTRRKGSVSRTRGTETTPDPVRGLTGRFKREVGQKVMLTDDKGQAVGKGKIYLARGSWFEMNLEEHRLCVVDVHDIKLPTGTELPHPHPSDGGVTFCEADSIFQKMRILWDSRQLLLIQNTV